MESLIDSLEIAYVRASLSRPLQEKLSFYKVTVRQKTLCVEFPSAYEKWNYGPSVFYPLLLREIGTNAVLAQSVNRLEFRYPLDPEPWTYMLSTTKALQSLHLPILSEYEILQELNQNWQQINGEWVCLPGSLVAMSDGKPLMVANSIAESAGVGKSTVLRLPSNNDFIPPDELDRYLGAVIAEKGAPAIIEYKAPKVSDPRLYQRRVEARLVKTEWGEVCRLVKNLAYPRSLV